jgi:hypothetical protein
MPAYTITSRHNGALLAQDRFAAEGDFADVVEAARQDYAATGRRTCIHDESGRVVFKICSNGDEYNYQPLAVFRRTDDTTDIPGA